MTDRNTTCRACGQLGLHRVLDLGSVPAADHFPLVGDPVGADECAHRLAMELCPACGLAQLAEDDTVTDEPRGVEPQALRDQAAAAVDVVAAAGLLPGGTVREFGSPHGGTWEPLLTQRGYTDRSGDSGPADVVLDCFGIMHEPDQRAAFRQRAQATAPDGVLLLQYHSIATIIRDGQWNALRHGHFAYYSLTTLVRQLAAVDMAVVAAWEFDLYGGTVLLAAVHSAGRPAESTVAELLADEHELGVLTPEAFHPLQGAADVDMVELQAWLRAESAAGRDVYGYAAASRAVALFARAGLDTALLKGVADASDAKQGRRMPGTDIPIISPSELVAADPDLVLLTVPDLFDEVSRRHPTLAGRLCTDRPDSTERGPR
ncbi:class I SAM-dependent methyltransferase [Mycolicibacterium komossense]|uniref:Methyltransferase domain-containing protein n=1 Tax=Mycolicibacterium komossense TaxID=1779 RepID=A0ABT3CLR1_9MYCO|nr:class I SAM-dependent methyltransferase [Mycolicibacterium komossense]MCV7230283.1 methyltransferase domain-containing protein [Mycolicibacterium komossense]